MGEPRTAPRFPSVAEGRGHYESFYVRTCHPSEPLGAWIRYTVHKRPGERPKPSLWFTLFDAAAGGPVASKVTLEPDALAAGDGAYVRIGDSRFEDGRAIGRAQSDGADASWSLSFESPEPPFHYLPRDWMYRAPVPRTKTLSPYPNARFGGSIEVDGRRIELDGWPGMVGHNWGSEHAERWIWTHGLLFDGAETAWFDAAIGRIKVGPLTTPWVANGVVSLDGRRHRLGGPGRQVKVADRPDGAEFSIAGKGVAVHGAVGSDRRNFVGWQYADPDGPQHNTVNCSIAEMRLTVALEGREPLELRTAHGAAYELGMRETDHGIPVQPFPDG
ncbi:MAG TPA: hypothetical protein VF520_00025 [Thermoleophilaceae bacterium]|jgi:hypothetical protein